MSRSMSSDSTKSPESTTTKTIETPAESLNAFKKYIHHTVDIRTTPYYVEKHGDTPFTIYKFTITCKMTNTWWILQKRYSQVYTLRETLRTLLKLCKSTKGLEALSVILENLHKVPFPHRHLTMDNVHIIRERKDGLQEFIAFVLWLKYTCQIQADLPGPTRSKARDIVNLISRFIEQPVEVEDEDYRLSTPNADTSPHKAKQDECMICLCYYHPEDNDEVFELTCGHAFHESCLSKWLDKKLNCPLCRNKAVGGFIDAV